MIEANDVAGHRRGKQIAGSGRILEHIQAITIVEGHTHNGSQVGFHDIEIVMAFQAVSIGTPVDNGELGEIAKVEVVVVIGEPRRPNPFGITDGRDVSDAANLPGPRIDAIDLLMIRLDSVKEIVNRDHAVPGAVGLEIVRRQGNIFRGMSHLERAQVRDLVPGSVMMYAEHRVDSAFQAVTATSAAQIWKTPASGGQPSQVTRHGGFAAFETSDGRYLYYAKENEPGIWWLPPSGGDEIRILPDPSPEYWGDWALSERGIYYVSDASPHPAIEFFDFASKRVSRVAELAGLPPGGDPGFAVSPDGTRIIFSQVDASAVDLMLVEHFPFN